jgi:hypothetical protein
VAAEEPFVDHGGIRVADDRLGDEPALPARVRGAVGDVDVLDVVAETGVPTADLHQHRAAHQQAGAAEQPVALHRLSGARAVVPGLVLVRAAQEPEGRSAPDRPQHIREAAERWLPRAVRPEDERADKAGARVGICEADERVDRARLGHCVRIRDEHVLTGRCRHAGVHIRCERARARALEHARSGRQRPDAAGNVRDHDELVDLRGQQGQRLLELACVTVRDDDRGDRQESASR